MNEAIELPSPSRMDISARARGDDLFQEKERQFHVKIDRLFARLMPARRFNVTSKFVETYFKISRKSITSTEGHK